MNGGPRQWGDGGGARRGKPTEVGATAWRLEVPTATGWPDVPTATRVHPSGSEATRSDGAMPTPPSSTDWKMVGDTGWKPMQGLDLAPLSGAGCSWAYTGPSLFVSRPNLVDWLGWSPRFMASVMSSSKDVGAAAPDGELHG